MASHSESMYILWRLVDLDQRLVELEREEQRQRAELAKSEARHAAAHKAHIAAQAALTRARAESRGAEDELRTQEARVLRLENEGGKHSVGALDLARKAVDELETRALNLLQAAQEAELDESRTRGDEEAQRRYLEEDRKIFADRVAELHKVADGFRMQRAQDAAPLAPPVLEAYEAANKQNPGNGVCRINDRLCAGCGGELTMQHVVSVKAYSGIVRCPDCGRIHDVPRAG